MSIEHSPGLKGALEVLGNRFIGFNDSPAQEAGRVVYEATENGIIPKKTCERRVTCINGEEATVVFPTSHALLTRRGILAILKMGLGEKKR